MSQLTEAEVAKYNSLYQAGNDLIRGRILLDKVPLASTIGLWDRLQLRRGIKRFVAALEIAPAQWQCHFWIGKCYQRLGDKDAASDAFERARMIVPNDTSVLKEAANACLECEKPQLAIAFLRPACEAAPEDTSLRHNLALALFMVGRLDEARDLVTSVLKVDRDSSSEWLLSRILEVRRAFESQPRTFAELKRRV